MNRTSERHRQAWVGGATLLLSVAGCGPDDGTPTDVLDDRESSRVVASIDLVPTSITFYSLERTATLAATPRDSDGVEMTSPLIWSTDDAAVATVTEGGEVAAVGSGETVIRVTAGSVSTEAPVQVDQVPVRLTVAPSSDTLWAIGATLQMSGVVADSSGARIAGGDFLWSSSTPGVIAVNGVGLATAIEPGNGWISASMASLADSASIAMVQRVESVEVFPDSASVVVGSIATLGVAVRDANGHEVAGADLRWASRNPSIATVAEAGAVTGRAEGQTWIVASTSTTADSSLVVVRAEVASLSVSPTSHSFAALGDTVRLRLSGLDALGNIIPGISAAWSAIPSGVVESRGGGLFVAVGPGEAVVTARAGPVSAGANLAVRPTVASLTLSRTQVEFRALGDTVTVSADARDANGNEILNPSLNWVSLATSVASVSRGRIQAVTVGRTGVIASSGSVSDTVSVVVEQVPQSIAFGQASYVLDVGASVSVSASVLDALGSVVPGTNVDYSIGDALVATVDAAGSLTGVASGTTWVFADHVSFRDSALAQVRDPNAPVVHHGDLVISDQAVLDSVAAVGYERVAGSLVIGGVANLDGLGTISTIDGDLSGQIGASRNGTIQRVELPGLQSVGGTVRLQFTPQLASVRLPNLQTAGGVSLRNADLLTEVDLSGLEVVGGDLALLRNALVEVSLPRLREVGGELSVSEPNARTLRLGAVQSVGDGIVIEPGPVEVSLPSLVGFHDVRVLGGDHLASVHSVMSEGTLIVNANGPVAVDLPLLREGFVRVVGGGKSSLNIPIADSLSVLDVTHVVSAQAPQLRVVGRLSIGGGHSESVSFPLLHTVDHLSIESSALIDLDGFATLRSPMTSVTVRRNAKLASVSGLFSVGDAGGADPIVVTFWVAENSSLPAAAVQALMAHLESKYVGVAFVQATVHDNGG